MDRKDEGVTMTLDNRRFPDRGPQPNRHVGPYYGSGLRRVIAPEPEEPESIIERMTEAWAHMTPLEAKFIAGCIIAAVFIAALIVAL